MSIKTSIELAEACKKVATDYKTLYVMGCFGAPMTSESKETYIKHHSYNAKPERATMIRAASSDTFGFDCVCFIKGLLWGWSGKKQTAHGGAKYKTNNVPDINADQMINVCSDVSTDFSDIQVGEVVWMKGHIGVYIGDGLAVESSPKWKNGVQITAVFNIGKKAGYNGRTWTKHGKLPYIEYPKAETVIKDAYYNVTVPRLVKGMKGARVKTLQALLVGYGYSVGSSGIDGSFGGATDEALRAYQAKNNLEVDGRCGPKTWDKLLNR